MLKHEGVPVTRRPRGSPDRACCGMPADGAVIGSESTSLIPVPGRPCQSVPPAFGSASAPATALPWLEPPLRLPSAALCPHCSCLSPPSPSAMPACCVMAL
jgi:hypothetical protein